MKKSIASRSREKFFDAAINLLIVDSPTTAAALTREQLTIRPDAESNVNGAQRPRCEACGSLYVNMRTVWPRQNKNRTKQKLNNVSEHYVTRHRMILRKCRTCNRSSKNLFQLPARTHQTLPASKTVEPPKTLPPSDEPEPEAKSTTASSKKRAKARNQGLQALLNQRKQEVGSTQRFGLMDFMRPG